jgi:hypothetical protein
MTKIMTDKPHPDALEDGTFSRSTTKRLAIELRDTVGWDMTTLRYELRYQQADGIHTMGPGRCGHSARGSGFCAKCLQAEIDRRATARDGRSE